MLKMNKNKKGQAGFVVTVELLLIVTILVIGLISGWAKVRDQVNSELSDAGNAIGAIDNSYGVVGLQWSGGAAVIAESAGWSFQDASDDSPAAYDGATTGDGMVVGYTTSIPTPQDEADVVFTNN